MASLKILWRYSHEVFSSCTAKILCPFIVVCVYRMRAHRKCAGDLHADAGEPEGARVVSGRKVRLVHSLGRVQRAGQRRMDHGNAARQPYGLREAAEFFQSNEV